MFKVMVTLQTLNGTITRVAGEFGGPDGLQSAERHRKYWQDQPTTLLAWIA